MPPKPWYKVVTPREDLREGRPLDTAEFAVHLDHVRDGRAPPDYQDPRRFFDRTFMTENLTFLASQVIRRLSGQKVETSAVFNLATQFGGGKTHALTLLYHLATSGPEAVSYTGVFPVLNAAQINQIPKARVAVFVGTEFDSNTGRGGADGTPIRKTPWGEIAWQLGGMESFGKVLIQEKKLEAPGGDVIRSFIPKETPCLILIDELMNYVTRYRRQGLSDQLYAFLQNLSETIRGLDNVVLVVSIPASELEMTAEDQSDYDRLTKLLDRIGKPVLISAGKETHEIIRRRLFEWDGLPKEANETIKLYSQWILEHRDILPGWFQTEQADKEFAASYPFHPLTISVFERKWQALPKFQQTRGVLRLLAHWVSRAYRDGYKGAHKDLLIDPGTAPLDDSNFRIAVFEQLGERRLEAAVTTDIAGSTTSHAIRLDQEAGEEIKKARLHLKVATAIFLESNGGQAKKEATIPELRLALGAPGIDVMNIETALEALAPPGGICYYLHSNGEKYWFHTVPNLVKVVADRKAAVAPQIESEMKKIVETVFSQGNRIDKVFYPQQSNQIANTPSLKLVILSPEQSATDAKTISTITKMTEEHGTSGRTYKNALIWVIPDDIHALKEEVRTYLAWLDLKDKPEPGFDKDQRSQVELGLKKSERDAKEAVWRSYIHLGLWDKSNTIRTLDLGMNTSSSANNIIDLILHHLELNGEITDSIAPNFLKRNWPPAFVEWPTQHVRDTFYASPIFPRLLHPEKIVECIKRGVEDGTFGYGGVTENGSYDPFYFFESLPISNIEINQDMYLIPQERAKAYKEQISKPKQLSRIEVQSTNTNIYSGKTGYYSAKGYDEDGNEVSLPSITWTSDAGLISDRGVLSVHETPGEYHVTCSSGDISISVPVIVKKKESDDPDPELNPEAWTGELDPNEWMSFYTKIIDQVGVFGEGIKIDVTFSITDPSSIDPERLEKINQAFREMRRFRKLD